MTFSWRWCQTIYVCFSLNDVCFVQLCREVNHGRPVWQLHQLMHKEVEEGQKLNPVIQRVKVIMVNNWCFLFVCSFSSNSLHFDLFTFLIKFCRKHFCCHKVCEWTLTLNVRKFLNRFNGNRTEKTFSFRMLNTSFLVRTDLRSQGFCIVVI